MHFYDAWVNWYSISANDHYYENYNTLKKKILESSIMKKGYNLVMKIFQTENVNESECDTTNIIWYDALNVMYS